MSKRREHKILHGAPCPACGAARGERCRLESRAEHATAPGRLLVHGARREAWQEWRREHGVDVYARTIGRGPAGVLTGTHEDATLAVRRLACGHNVRDELGYRVPDLRAAIDTLTRDGWIVE